MAQQKRINKKDKDRKNQMRRVEKAHFAAIKDKRYVINLQGLASQSEIEKVE